MDTRCFSKKQKPYNEKGRTSSSNGAGITGCFCVEEWKIDSYLSRCTIFKSTWNKDTNEKQLKVGKSLEVRNAGENFLKGRLMAQVLRSTINKWNLMKLKSFCKEKDIVNRMKWQLTNLDKIFNKSISDRGRISKIHKGIKKLDTNNPKTQLKWGT